MWTFICIVAAAATIAFGFFIMKKVDRFLEGNQQSQRVESLCIGISNPMTVDGVTEILDRFEQRYPEVPVRLFQDRDEKLVKELVRDKLDVVFVSEATEIPPNEDYVPQAVSLEVRPIYTKYDGLAIEPISGGTFQLTALWRRTESVPSTRYFVKCLQSVCGNRWKNSKQVL